VNTHQARRVHISRRKLALGLAIAPAIVRAQTDWPSRPVRIVVPTAAGGAVDVLARLMAPQLAQRLGQPFFVENRPGPGTILGMQAVARSPADGYTLLFAAGPLAINSALGMTLPYDPMTDFTYVSKVASIPTLVVVHPSRPHRTLADLVRAGRQEGLNMAVPVVGSLTHLLAEVLRTHSGANFIIVPYRGAGLAVQDVVAGNVDAFYDGLVPTGQHVLAGRLRGIAVGSRTRSPLLPDVASVSEQGMDDLLASAFFGMLGPSGLPEGIVARLHAALLEALAADEVRERLLAQGYVIDGTTGDEYRSFIAAEIARWKPVVAAAGIRI